MSGVFKNIVAVSCLLVVLLVITIFLGLSMGSSGAGFSAIAQAVSDAFHSGSMMHDIIWKIRFPRVILAALVGATLSLGGLVFQALLRNPLAEPYILGISGGSAIGAIIGILLGLARFPGVGILAFIGGMATLFLVLGIAAGRTVAQKESLLLAGVMVNAFCSAVIMFLISLSRDARLHNIMFWLMGDLSSASASEVMALGVMVLPCFVLVFWMSHRMNLLLMGGEMAQSMGVNVRLVTLTLLVITSFMTSATVAQCGLIAFVGLVIPHLLRLLMGSDHRVLVPACIFGGGAYLVICDLLARTLPRQGEMPAGVITAMVGAPVFIFLLRRRGGS
ncbi:MAG: iron ABC transporter permease [Desulfobacterales bacterium]|nr:iron ABC transporter permease [Desulfobacterales bacterium]MBS3754642.1 iron ABC transporter permease [Desulfobacterales bacterium]